MIYIVPLDADLTNIDFHLAWLKNRRNTVEQMTSYWKIHLSNLITITIL